MYDDDFEIDNGDPHQDYWFDDDFEMYNQNEADDYRHELDDLDFDLSDGPTPSDLYHDYNPADDYCEMCGWVPCVCEEYSSELNEEGGDIG